MKIVITGANGQLGRSLRDCALKAPNRTHNYLFTDIAELDICRMEEIVACIEAFQPDVIVNAAAYTAVDRAEEEPEEAYRINRDAVRNLAQVAQKRNIHLIHISTDYVFSGTGHVPHKTTDPIAPLSIYGKSKAAGEQAIIELSGHATIIRTSWLYSEYGHNFVKTMLQLGQERAELYIVYDQIGAPTYAGDLADAIFAAIQKGINENGVHIYNYANEGVTSWYDFAYSIMKLAGLNCRIRPILTSQYPTKAVRPAYSVFDLAETRRDLSLNIPHWMESLKLTINKLRK